MKRRLLPSVMYLLPFLLFLWNSLSAGAQDPEQVFQLEDADWLNQTENTADPDQLDALQTKADLNDTLNLADLFSWLLTPAEIGAIRRHIRTFGPLQHLNELQVILPLSRIEVLYPYFQSITPKSHPAKSGGRAEIQVHHSNHGNTFRHRGQIFILNSEMVWTVEQDAGETWRSLGKGYFDHVNFGAAIPLRSFDKLLLGAGRARFGEGLFTRNLFMNQKSSDAVRMKAEGAGLRLNSSFDENSLLGIHCEKQIGGLKILTSTGTAKVDGRPTENLNSFTGFNTSGLHSNVSENQAMDFVRRTQLLLHLSYENDLFLIGISSNTEWLSKAMQPVLRADNSQYPRGGHFQDIGGNFRISAGNLLMFGEVKCNLNGNPSALLGAIFSLGRAMDLSLLMRSYHASNTSWNSSAFGNYSENRNEQGLFMGYKWYVSKYSRLDLVFDRYRRPVFIYPSPALIGGGSDCTLSFKHRSGSKAENQYKFRISRDLRSPVDKPDMRFYLNRSQELIPGLQWNIRAQFVASGALRSSYMNSEWRLSCGNWRATLITGYQVQKGGEGGLYYYEKDLLNSFYVHRMSGTSWRHVGIVEFKATQGHLIRLKLWQNRTLSAEPEFGLKLQCIIRWE